MSEMTCWIGGETIGVLMIWIGLKVDIFMIGIFGVLKWTLRVVLFEVTCRDVTFWIGADAIEVSMTGIDGKTCSKVTCCIVGEGIIQEVMG